MLPFYRVRHSWVGISIFVVLFSLCLAQLHAEPVPVSPWFGSANPAFEKIGDTDPSLTLPESIIGNRDCTERELVTRPRRYVAPLQTKISQVSCVVDTGYGSLSKSGLVQRAGSSIFGPITTNSGSTAIMLPVPRSSTGIRIGTSGGYGSYLFFYDELETKLSSAATFTGEVSHKLPAEYSAMLKDRAGNLLAVDTGSASFSPDGEWMVADIPFVAMARINVKTREVVPFGDAINYNIGVGPAYKTAISPNGRYAVIASKNFEIFRLYDLDTCGAAPAVITTKVTCSSRDLLPFVRQQLPSFTSVASMRLNNDFTIDMYANYMSGNNTKLGRFLVVAPGQEASTGFQYLALGDSFASGEGAYDYKAFTDTGDNKCHLSQRSYPYLIGSSLGLSKYESIACSGAVIEDLINTSDKYREKGTQSKGMSDLKYDQTIMTNFLPGYRAQVKFTQQYLPGVVTISASGNDIGFADKIARCLDTDTCYDSYEDRLEIVQEINTQFPRIVEMYNDIKRSADPRTKIYVIGYPQIAYADGVCDMNVHLNHDELVFAQQLTIYFNSVIKKATEKAGVFYVDMEDSLNGHRLCEQINSWDIAVNGLTAGNDNLNFGPMHGPIANESYHPNALGHSMMANTILGSTAGFTASMPTPNPNANISDPDPGMPFLQVHKSNRTIRTIEYYTATDGGAIHAGTTWAVHLSGLDVPLAVGSKVDAWLHSTPTYLGSYTVGGDGSIDISTLIPSTITPGFHTLHLYGKNSSGEDVDVYHTVYVDTGSACMVPVSGIDSDKDGIDDACDGFIAEPPVVVTPPGPEPEVNAPQPETPNGIEVVNEQTPEIEVVNGVMETPFQQANNPLANPVVTSLTTVATATLQQSLNPTSNANQQAVLSDSTTTQLPTTTPTKQATRSATFKIPKIWPLAGIVVIIIVVFLLFAL